jgi:hypothetical protein
MANVHGENLLVDRLVEGLATAVIRCTTELTLRRAIPVPRLLFSAQSWYVHMWCTTEIIFDRSGQA